MKQKYLLYAVLAVVAVVAAVIGIKQYRSGWSASPSPSDSGTVCTLDVRLCSDGSYVGRVGPRCEFAPCPTKSPAPTATVTVRPSSGY